MALELTPITAATDSYQTVAEADELAEKYPVAEFPKWNAASQVDKAKALTRACMDIDNPGFGYQGRKYDLTQARAFPRVAREHGSGLQTVYPYTTSQAADEIWDWDSTNNVAIVPPDVKLAELYQAESILAGDRERRMKARHDGVSSQGNDGMQEAYSGDAPVLCMRAHQLMSRYRLKTGGMV